MTSKESLETLFDLLCEREHTNSEHSFWLKLYQEVKEDLDLLETFEKHLVIDDNNDVWLKIEKDNTGYIKVEGIQWGNWGNDK